MLSTIIKKSAEPRAQTAIDEVPGHRSAVPKKITPRTALRSQPRADEELEVLAIEHIVGGDEDERLEQNEDQDCIAERRPEDVCLDVRPVL